MVINNRLRAWCSLAILCLCAVTLLPAQEAKRPKLVMLIAVDQFRYDYLTRYRSEYTDGLNTFLTKGANFVNANLEHYPTVTAIGHSTMMSGATPAMSGIVGNDWYDRESGGMVTSVSDPATQLLGGTAGKGSSPRRLLVSTVGDELKRARRGDTKVFGLSMKDRSAILPSGHMANGAFWFEDKTGNFVSSTYYFESLPDWVKKFNDGRMPDKYAGQEWAAPGGKTTKMPAEKGGSLYASVYGSPFGNEVLEAFAEAAITNEKLGQRDTTDVLTVSFSSNDAVGHSFGPDDPRAHDISVRTDKIIGKLFAFIDKTIGMDNVVVALTADHGVSPLPEQLQSDKMPGGRLTSKGLFGPVEAALEAKFGPGKWILDIAGTSPYFNLDFIAEKKLDPYEVERVAAQAVMKAPHVMRAYTREQLQAGSVPGDPVSQRVVRSFNTRRSGDIEILLEPYWIRSGAGTTHGTPYSYDSHIPLIIMGPGFKAGRYTQNVALNDLAPTLATMLDIETPSGSVGRVLGEALQ